MSDTTIQTDLDALLQQVKVLPDKWNDFRYGLMPEPLRRKKYDRYTRADVEFYARTVRAVQAFLALEKLVEAAEALADQEEATLSLDETRGNQKKVTPANMFLSVGRSDIREAIAEARRLLEGE